MPKMGKSREAYRHTVVCAQRAQRAFFNRVICDPASYRATGVKDSVAIGQTKNSKYKECLASTRLACPMTSIGVRKPPSESRRCILASIHACCFVSAVVATCSQASAMWVRIICGLASVHRQRRSSDASKRRFETIAAPPRQQPRQQREQLIAAAAAPFAADKGVQETKR